ncbi:MerR family transcriptional regulator [Sphaerotilus microaerophilus]|uniref:Uncharacterized protein n=1 Tax=Sphaerotilus microaerophilus TaxID=2914710 RepID=A0ABN6PGP7_9BURK|nr:MerR family transcriptional regulator [Sphaerotilus sp. FB-5]BDI03538.1 hypothetical protein CATMQ487_05080 [Sphaerotilus sp. FB-5]
MNTPVSVDDRLAGSPPRPPQSMGKRPPETVRDDQAPFNERQQPAAELQELEQSALNSPGRLAGWRFDRDEANQRGA